MTFLIPTFLILLLSSVSLNIFFIVKFRKKVKRPPSVELREFIGDMAAGFALLAFDGQGSVNRMDPNGLMYRSPKSK